MTGRFRRCSMAAPKGKAMTALATAAKAASKETWKVLASSTSTATSGSAPEPTALPTALSVNAVHSRRKS
jgi:hypothetical protein